MEHEVFVPFPVDSVRFALDDPSHVMTAVAAVPGMHYDAPVVAGEPPYGGRLRLRVAGSTITYRGELEFVPVPDGLIVEATGTEVRGDGSVHASLRINLSPAVSDAPGTLISFTGTLTAEGRIAECRPEAVAAGGRRLLDHFVAELSAQFPPVDPYAPEAVDVIEVIEVDMDDIPAEIAEFEVPDDVGDLAPPAEAAHARRTMIGRSAEEVDHAPPRGRYAPAPARDEVSVGATLRWAAPAAAVFLVSVVVVGRVLRRRR